jgi:outer membrane protein assembly factor BamA
LSLRCLIAGCLMLWGALAPAAARAQESAETVFGRTVTDVRFEVDGRVDASPALASAVDVRVGAPLTREAVRASMDHLYALARYDDVRPTVVETPGGVAVTFRLVPRYPVTRLEVAPGDTGLPAGALRGELEQRVGGVPASVRNETVADAATRILNDEGYLDAEVTADAVVDRSAGTATLVVAVEAGPRALVRRATVEGTSPLSAADVIERAGAATGAPYRRRAMDAALSAIEDDLRARGYYEAEATLTATPTAAGVDLVIVVEAGPRVELRVLPDADALPGRRDDLIPIRRERSADQDLLEDSQQAITRALRRDGYADATVTFTRELTPDNTVLLITFTITRGDRYYVDRIDLAPGLSLPADVLQDALGVQPGDVFDPDAIDRALVRVVDEYRRRGYYTASVAADRETLPGRGPGGQVRVVIHPNITEGPRGFIAGIAFTFTGPHAVREEDLRAAMRSRVGAPYVSADVALDQGTLLRYYREGGYLNASVGITPSLSENGEAVALAVTVTEGPQVLVARITVVGNEHVTEARILEAIRGSLDVGRPLAASAVATARQRLASLGVFRRVSVYPEERLSGETDARIVITVVEAPDTTVGFGGGLEGSSLAVQVGNTFEDRIDLSPRGFFEIGRRNLGGKNRSLNFFSRVSFNRRDREPSGPDARAFGFTEYRVTTTYREQRAFNSDTDVLVGLTSEQGIRTTYKFLRRSANVEGLHRLGARLSASGRYALEFTRLFDERVEVADQPLIDRLFPQVRLSYFSTGVTWDGRDNPLVPTRGMFLTADAEVAGRAIGSEVGYIKTFFQASNFVRLGATSKTVFATRAQLGLARGFERTVMSTDAEGQPRTDVVSDLPISQRFFAGGSTSVRGFQIDRLGVYNPMCAGCGVIDPVTGLSLGGNSLLVLNGELRRTVTRLFNRNLGVVGFLDGGNVFAKAADLDLLRLRGAAGFGVRYDSPLGPVRLDFGFKISRRTIAGQRESAWEYHLSIGEAF